MLLQRALVAALLFCLACTPKERSSSATSSTAAQIAPASSAVPAEAPKVGGYAEVQPPAMGASSATGVSAIVGQPAPNFLLPAVGGDPVSLEQHRGKIVVLEWFNPDCPFVRSLHTKGTLKDAAARHAKHGVVWLAINSGAPGKQGHGVERNRKAKQEYSMDHPVLLDESGEVGRRYGAKRTPHMIVIDPKGVLVYAGAIDNSPDGEGQEAPGGQLVHYVDDAIAAIVAGKPVAVSSTEAYGCSVKY